MLNYYGTLKLALAFLKSATCQIFNVTSAYFLVKDINVRQSETLTLFVGMERSRLKMAEISCLLGSDIFLSVGYLAFQLIA